MNNHEFIPSTVGHSDNIIGPPAISEDNISEATSDSRKLEKCFKEIKYFNTHIKECVQKRNEPMKQRNEIDENIKVAEKDITEEKKGILRVFSSDAVARINDRINKDRHKSIDLLLEVDLILYQEVQYQDGLVNLGDCKSAKKV